MNFCAETDKLFNVEQESKVSLRTGYHCVSKTSMKIQFVDEYFKVASRSISLKNDFKIYLK